MSLLAKFANKDRRALAKIISHIENREDGYQEILARIYPDTGHAIKIGLTGPPGAGKSSLVDRLTELFARDGKKVAIIAVDPSSPFTGGAFLGDRIRMQDLAGNESVFIRSMATRGSTGGLAQATKDVSMIFDAFGFDYVLIETVGVGQVELDIIDATDSVVVVLVPESGDAIQAMKAGLMEIADVFCLNKCDREGADRIVVELNYYLQIKRAHSEWTYPVISTSAIHNQGVDLLAQALRQHHEYLLRSNLLKARRKEQIKKELFEHISLLLTETIEKKLTETNAFDALLEQIYSRETDPINAALRIFHEHYSHSAGR